MRVLLTGYPDASWTYTVELIRGLEREGVHVVLAVMGRTLEPPQRAELRTLRNVEFYESTYRAEWDGADERELESAGNWLLDLAQRHDVDVVHLNERAFAALPWRARPIVTVHREPWTGDANCLLAAPARALIPSGGAVIPFGRSSAAPSGRAKEPMILTEGSYGDGNSNVGALTRVAPRLSWPVFIIGVAPGYSVVRTSLANSHFLGPMAEADAAAVIARASVFAQPFAAPENGYMITDAALCGCALVLADIAELREQWDGAASFVEPGDDESLRSQLIWLMSDAEARGDLGSRARYRAGNYTAEKMASAYLALYIEATLPRRLSTTTPRNRRAH